MDNLEKRVFIICPVRDATKEEKEFLESYVLNLRLEGDKVHYPPENTEQNYMFGYRICSQNRSAIERADEVHIYFNPNSAGSFFDIGMTFMAEKPLHIINQNAFDKEKADDVTKFILKYSTNVEIKQKSKLYTKLRRRKRKIEKLEVIKYKLQKEKTAEFLFDFGMAFMARTLVKLTNRKEIKPTPHKSFENVLLVLDGKYRRRK